VRLGPSFVHVPALSTARRPSIDLAAYTPQGTVFGIVSATCAAGAFVAIRQIGNREPALVMSVWFHSTSLVSCLVPLLIGYPSPPVWPGAVDAVNLCSIAITSFFGQMLLSRGFQLQSAAKASAINLTQARLIANALIKYGVAFTGFYYIRSCFVVLETDSLSLTPHSLSLARYLQVVWSYFFGLVFLNAVFSWLGALGSLLISAGAILVNLKRPPRQDQESHQHEAHVMINTSELDISSHGEHDGNRALKKTECSSHFLASEHQLTAGDDDDDRPLLAIGFSASSKKDNKGFNELSPRGDVVGSSSEAALIGEFPLLQTLSHNDESSKLFKCAADLPAFSSSSSDVHPALSASFLPDQPTLSSVQMVVQGVHQMQGSERDTAGTEEEASLLQPRT